MGNLALGSMRRIRPTRTEVVGLTVFSWVFTFWNIVAQQALSPRVLGFFLVFCWACVLVGRVAARIVSEQASADFPTAFLLGFLLLNSALLVLAWISPFSISINGLFLLACALVLQWVGRPPDPEHTVSLVSPSLLVVILSLVAASLWAQDSIRAQIVLPECVLLRPWVDSLFHARQIQTFRDAIGPVAIDDPRMAGQPMWFYHHGSYLVPALLSKVSGTPAFLAHASFQVPFGLVLTGLAAYALVGSLWGARAGVAAASVLYFVPDASWHGLASPWLSYHWLQQVAPAGLYGVAILAVAWLLMFEGCRSGRLSLVALAFLTTGFALHYKAHLFVAAAFLVWIYPGVFLRGVRWRWKLVWLAFAVASFVGVVALSRRVESIPVLRLDGSAIKEYLSVNISWLTSGSDRQFFTARLTPTSSFSQDLFWGAVLLAYGTVGFFGLALLVILFVVLRRRVLRETSSVRLEHVVFPFLILGNYLVMALGLAFNNKPPAHREELLHRPFVWAYFVVSAWAGGLVYALYLKDRVRRSDSFRNTLVVALMVWVGVPYLLGQNVQVGPHWGRTVTNLAYPRGYFECARYIREHAPSGDVVQDAEGDPRLMFGAIGEHPAYAIDYFDPRRPPALLKRLEELRGFKAMTDAVAIRQFAARRRIRWFVTHPSTRLGWPASIRKSPVFCSKQFCVYSFVH